ncbi:MAG: hypothetical protein R2715_01765 [Ilumatobacteraceae bacterium]
MTYFIAQTWWMWAAVVILTWVGTAAAGWIRRAAPQRRSIARLQRELGDARTQIGRYEQRLEELDVERDLHLQEIDHLHDRLRAEHDVRLQLDEAEREAERALDLQERVDQLEREAAKVPELESRVKFLEAELDHAADAALDREFEP